MKILNVLIFLLIFLAVKVFSRCNNYWRDISGDDETTRGLITVYPKNYREHNLRIFLQIAAQLSPSTYVGTISLYKDKQKTLNDVANGLPILYRVRFLIQNPLPKLTAIYYNNEQLCSESYQNECDNYWKFILGSDGSTQGLITLYPKNYLEHNLKISLYLPAKLPSRYVGDMNLLNDLQSTVNDVTRGLPIVYRVRFPVQNPLPKLTAIYYNNELLCSERTPRQSSGYFTTITLDHKLFTDIPIVNQPRNQQIIIRQPSKYQFEQLSHEPPRVQPYYEPSFRSQFEDVQPVYRTYPPQSQAPVTRPPTTRPVTYRTTLAPRLVTHKESKHLPIIDGNSCGVPEVGESASIGLVIGGKVAKKGQFPWLAAFYYNGYGNNGDRTGLICGGSLISAQVVLTAAHCILPKNNEIPKKPEESFFLLGKHNLLMADEKNVIYSGISEFILHPSYNAKVDSYDGDIAITILQRVIQFNTFIQPICLWPQTLNYDDLIDKEGTIAGWGKTDKKVAPSNQPHYIHLPVVEESTCLRSNQAFNTITSKRTFCVGENDGTGPCEGDSGSGFIVENGGKWYLRGIVSSALYDRVKRMCDTSNYAVFTDVAQYHNWIVQSMARR